MQNKLELDPTDTTFTANVEALTQITRDPGFTGGVSVLIANRDSTSTWKHGYKISVLRGQLRLGTEHGELRWDLDRVLVIRARIGWEH